MADRNPFSLLAQALREAVTDQREYLPALPTDPASIGNLLNDLDLKASVITDAEDFDAWVEQLSNFFDALKEFPQRLAREAITPDELVFRILLVHFPRTTALLVLAGAIEFEHADGAFKPVIHWDKVYDFITAPETVVNEGFWSSLLGDVDIESTGYLPAALAGMILLAPNSIAALAAGDLNVKDLQLPPVRDDDSPVWRDFRHRSANWYSFTVPLSLPNPGEDSRSVSMLDFESGMTSADNITVAFRSDRILENSGDSKTLFETWVALGLEQDQWAWNIVDDWTLTIEPGLAFGFGYDGDWHAAFRALDSTTMVPPTGANPLVVRFGRNVPDDQPDILFGPPYDTRLEMQDVELFLKVRETEPVFEAGLEIKGLAIVVTNRWWRVFGITDDLLTEGIRFELDLAYRYLVGIGSRLNLSSNLDILFNIDKSVGTGGARFKLHSIRVQLPINAREDSISGRIQATCHISVVAGPVTLVMDGFGIWGGWWKEHQRIHRLSHTASLVNDLNAENTGVLGASLPNHFPLLDTRSTVRKVEVDQYWDFTLIWEARTIEIRLTANGILIVDQASVAVTMSQIMLELGITAQQIAIQLNAGIVPYGLSSLKSNETLILGYIGPDSWVEMPSSPSQPNDTWIIHDLRRAEYRIRSELNESSQPVLDIFDNSYSHWGLLPPTGLGLGIEVAGVIEGGGYLDYSGSDRDRYAGLATLRFFDQITVTGYGIVEELPNGESSLIVILGAQWSPGWQIIAGVSISGFGGIFGKNRKVDTDALRERLTSGGAGNVLFAPDPIQNAPAILRDVDAIFPANMGTCVIGPTLRLDWLQFIFLDLGIVFELPGPSKIVILGSGRSELVVLDVIVFRIRIDFTGGIDRPKKMIFFDATLYQSKLGPLHITGDAAVRSHSGSQPYTLFTVGGFHPEFNAAPAVFPEITRVAVTEEFKGLLFRAEAYLAFTDNSFQFGGLVEMIIRGSSFRLTGFVALDVLIQFRPFYFDIELSAGFRVRWKSITLAELRLSGQLTGPSPMYLTGKVRFKVLFIKVTIKANIKIADGPKDLIAPIVSLLEALTEELTVATNLVAIGTREASVIVAERTLTSEIPLVSPMGSLAWTQKKAPLETLIDRVSGTPLATPQAIIVETPFPSTVVRELFSPGSFADLTQSEALNRPSFERLPGGVVIDFSAGNGEAFVSSVVNVDLDPEVVILPKPTLPWGLLVTLPHPEFALQNSANRTASAHIRATGNVVMVSDAAWTVRDVEGSTIASELSASDAHARVKYSGGHAVAQSDVLPAANF